MEYKFKNYFEGTKLQSESSDTIISMISEFDRLVKGTDNIIEALKTENEAKSEGVRIPDELSYSDIQITRLEDIFSEMDLEEMSTIKNMIASLKFADFSIVERLYIYFGTLFLDLLKLKGNVDDYITLDDAEIIEIRDRLKSSLGFFLYCMNMILSLDESVSNKEFLSDVIRYTSSVDVDPLEWALDKLQMSKTKYHPILNDFEECPELWSDFLDDIPKDCLNGVLMYAEKVTVKDIQNFNKGLLVVDDDYINLLKDKYEMDQESATPVKSNEEDEATSELIKFYGGVGADNEVDFEE